jgi:hypothetical protein
MFPCFSILFQKVDFSARRFFTDRTPHFAVNRSFLCAILLCVPCAEKSTFPHGAQLPPLSAAFPRRPQELTKHCIRPHPIPRRAQSKWKKRNNSDGK